MKFQTVEWSRNVARIHAQLTPSVTHWILPDLPGADLNEEAFFDDETSNSNNLRKNRIVTIAAGSHHTFESFDQALRQHQHHTNKFLIVGGNTKGAALSVLDGISRAKSILLASDAGTATDVWCVANPNNKGSIDGVKDKILAGADGVVTQPLLTSYAAEVLDSYPSTSSGTPTTTIAGVALPKTERGLLFWLQLLGEPNEIEADELFQASLKHFQSRKSPLDWAQSQIAMYPPKLDGLHFMPMSNTDLLLDLLAGKGEI
jgi:hypothetical protein